MVSFEVVLRGYDRGAVDALVQAVEAAGDQDRIVAAIKDAGPLPVVLRGYDPAQVDTWLAGHGAGFDPGPPELTVVLRGYDRVAVDALMATVAAALAGKDPARRSAALRAIGEAQLPVVWRGYDRREVDLFLEMTAEMLREP